MMAKWSIVDVLMVMFLVISLICVLTHFYMFYKSEPPRRFVTKFLTLYCFYLFLFYLYLVNAMVSLFEVSFEMEMYMTYNLLLTLAFLKFIIALDICMCFRNTTLYLQNSTKSRNTMFHMYFLFGTVTPLMCSWFVYMKLPHRANESFTWALTSVRVSRIIPLVLAFWYLKKASIDKASLKANFQLHLRLLVIMGGLSSIVDMASVTCSAIGFRLDILLEQITDVGVLLEGIVIAVCFTFKKDTFRGPEAVTKGSNKTESLEMAKNLT